MEVVVRGRRALVRSSAPLFSAAAGSGWSGSPFRSALKSYHVIFLRARGTSPLGVVMPDDGRSWAGRNTLSGPKRFAALHRGSYRPWTTAQASRAGGPAARVEFSPTLGAMPR